MDAENSSKTLQNAEMKQYIGLPNNKKKTTTTAKKKWEKWVEKKILTLDFDRVLPHEFVEPSFRYIYVR